MYYYDRLVTKISTAMAVIAALLLFTATVILSWMVLARSFGIHGTWELELSIELMICAIFLGSPYTLATGGHVKMDLLSAILGGRAGAITSIIAEALGFLVCFYIGYKGIGLAYEAFITNEKGMGLWQPVLWPRYSMVPIGMFMTCLQYISVMHTEVRKVSLINWKEQQS